MSIFSTYQPQPAYFRKVKLKIDVPYVLIHRGVRKNVRFVPSTERGFNFEEEGSYQRLYKKHFYPKEVNRKNLKAVTVVLPNSMKIEENGIRI